jgi:hypothetical protein
VSLLAETYTVRPIGFERSAIDKPADDCWAGLISVSEFDSQSRRARKRFLPLRAIRAIAPTVRKLAFLHSAKDRPNHIGVTTCRQLDPSTPLPSWTSSLMCRNLVPRKPVRQAAWSPELMASCFQPPK